MANSAPANSAPIITLLTDFGLRDHFVAAMKGVMLSVNPEIQLVDISNLVPPQDIFTGAFTLSKSWSYFPPGTIHLAIVDPGVGARRKALAVQANAHYFVAPDNGILTYVFDEYPSFEAYEITAEHYYRKPVSQTFHGRDIFAPVAAHRGVDQPWNSIATSRCGIKRSVPAGTACHSEGKRCIDPGTDSGGRSIRQPDNERNAKRRSPTF